MKRKLLKLFLLLVITLLFCLFCVFGFCSEQTQGRVFCLSSSRNLVQIVSEDSAVQKDYPEDLRGELFSGLTRRVRLSVYFALVFAYLDLGPLECIAYWA